MRGFLSALSQRINWIVRTRQARRHSMVGPATLWKMKRDFQIQFLKAMGLAPHHHLLDFGCGTLRGGIPLISYLNDGHYCGIEAREDVLDAGRMELQDAGLEYKQPLLLHCTDISQLVMNRHFDYIWAFSVLIHMEDGILSDALGFIRRCLSESGVFFANVNVGDRREGKWHGYPVVWRTLEFYIRECSKNGFTVTDMGALRDHGHISHVDLQDSQCMLALRRSC